MYASASTTSNCGNWNCGANEMWSNFHWPEDRRAHWKCLSQCRFLSFSHQRWPLSWSSKTWSVKKRHSPGTRRCAPTRLNFFLAKVCNRLLKTLVQDKGKRFHGKDEEKTGKCQSQVCPQSKRVTIRQQMIGLELKTWKKLKNPPQDWGHFAHPRH